MGQPLLPAAVQCSMLDVNEDSGSERSAGGITSTTTSSAGGDDDHSDSDISVGVDDLCIAVSSICAVSKA